MPARTCENFQEETESGVTEKDVNGSEAPVVAAEEKTEKLTKFPLGRVKHIMKMDPDLTMASQESVFLVSKALEMFVESLARSGLWRTFFLSDFSWLMVFLDQAKVYPVNTT